VTFEGKTRTQEFTIQPSYASGSYVPLHFGLGGANRIDALGVIWPDGTVQALPPPALDRAYRLSKKEGLLEGLRGPK
ncbi:MAG TPA: ASPIC/UnbV domain-containing protein, partial [Thermoanaerobaculia bacterium]|nr:ASPIC/UnbV domain-containing protein [Thermoanaerobaculia bacterium]